MRGSSWLGSRTKTVSIGSMSTKGKSYNSRFLEGRGTGFTSVKDGFAVKRLLHWVGFIVESHRGVSYGEFHNERRM